MNQIMRRQCGNCAAFGPAPGVACGQGVTIVGPEVTPRAPMADDTCTRHRTDLEAQHAEYEHSADLVSPNAPSIVGGAQAW